MRASRQYIPMSKNIKWVKIVILNFYYFSFNKQNLQMINSRSSSPSDRFIKPHRPSINQKRPSPPESDSSDDDQFTFSPVHSPALNNGTFTNGSRKFILTPAHEYYYRQKLLSLSRVSSF